MSIYTLVAANYEKFQLKNPKKHHLYRLTKVENNVEQCTDENYLV